MQSPWQRAGVPWRSRKPAVPAAEPHLHPAAEPQLRTALPRPPPSAPQCPPAAGPGGPAGLTCCLARRPLVSGSRAAAGATEKAAVAAEGWRVLRPRWGPAGCGDWEPLVLLLGLDLH